jgi:excisionase family DNA binding protein
MADREPWQSAAQIAVFLGVTPTTVRDWARTGVIPGYQPGGREWLFKASEVDAAVMASRKQTEQPAAPVPIRRRRSIATPIASVTSMRDLIRSGELR